MKRWKPWIVWLCGLLLAVQGFASAASLLPSIVKAPMQPAMQMGHCNMPTHKPDGAQPPCCGDQCGDMAHCFSPATSNPFQRIGIVAMPVLSPPPHRISHFVPPDPDAQLRPPIAFLG